MKEKINKDFKEINEEYCDSYGCKEKAMALLKSKLLCEKHYREKKPQKERIGFRLPPIPFYGKGSKLKS